MNAKLLVSCGIVLVSLVACDATYPLPDDPLPELYVDSDAPNQPVYLAPGLWTFQVGLAEAEVPDPAVKARFFASTWTSAEVKRDGSSFVLDAVDSCSLPTGDMPLRYELYDAENALLMTDQVAVIIDSCENVR